MTPFQHRLLCSGLALIALATSSGYGAPVELWPGAAPGETRPLLSERDSTTTESELIAGRRVTRLENVSVPTLTIHRPPPDKDTGAAVLVCPGGGYYVITEDLEGTEVCAWLNSIGVTGVVLKYRVPRREGREKHAAAFQDAQRALGWLRSQADTLGLDPHRIGVLGFSAGGHLAAMLSNQHAERTYPAVDAADAFSCRPDFCVLIYPAYLTGEGKHGEVAPALAPRAAVTPPTFIAMAQDDPLDVRNAVAYYLAIQQAGIPAELHLYPTGRHGYGLRRTKDDVTTWPDRVADWLRAGGWLQPAK